MTATPRALTAGHADAQSLSQGPAAAALRAVEQARSGTATILEAARLLGLVTGVPVDGGTHTSLYYGAPTVGVLLHAAAPLHPAFGAAASEIDKHVQAIVRRRLTASVGHAPESFTDFDLLYGLTGLGSYLLHHLPASDELGAVLDYVVALTHDRSDGPRTVPGWWALCDPDTSVPAPGGHANNGMAHGAAGMLALLARASMRGHQVGGHHDAIRRLLAWFDRWQYDTGSGPAWPPWITLPDLDSGTTGRQHRHRPRPSWCYGTPGIGRAQQLAAAAIGDCARREFAEHALTSCTEAANLALLTEPGICHGTAGLDQTLFRAGADMTNQASKALLTTYLHRRTTTQAGPTSDDGFITGGAGAALVHDTLTAATAPATGWDTCLLLI
ncbi:lanthionine synthetase [Actinoplanes sp. ATCC 53533]|uniref:lanthionine synthetase C family protein n=1 Tax=Actinoplanes sp. ATCC 53533 TaxID=1288362 RepID=UPI000F7960C7|nr:lanthionine synthetase C family protein [Actinoplanes sp. ATCC 53533]RSM52341.1 lanthionine synthetase [Actinoplanes sp. ATCC 53533]